MITNKFQFPEDIVDPATQRLDEELFDRKVSLLQPHEVCIRCAQAVVSARSLLRERLSLLQRQVDDPVFHFQSAPLLEAANGTCQTDM